MEVGQPVQHHPELIDRLDRTEPRVGLPVGTDVRSIDRLEQNDRRGGSVGERPRVELDGHHLSATVDRDQLNDAMAELSQYGITRLNVAPPSLESLFLRQYDGLAS